MKNIWDLSVGYVFEWQNDTWYIISKNNTKITFKSKSFSNTVKSFQKGQNINVKPI